MRLESTTGTRIATIFGMIRVLLVEDSDDILFILQMELEWMGFVVDIAKDAGAAVDIARLTHPDVIVSDLRMPAMDGFEFIKRVL